jgi:hypothetical protein
MSTHLDAQNIHTDDTDAYGQPDAPGGAAAARQYRIAAIVIGTVVATALIVLAAVGLTHTTSSSTPAPRRLHLPPGRQPGPARHRPSTRRSPPPRRSPRQPR